MERALRAVFFMYQYRFVSSKLSISAFRPRLCRRRSKFCRQSCNLKIMRVIVFLTLISFIGGRVAAQTDTSKVASLLVDGYRLLKENKLDSSEDDLLL